MGQKNSFFEKRTGEVVENTGSGPKNEPERTGKRSGEVVENTRGLKKRTGNEAGHVIENTGQLKKRTRTSPGK
ncbi:MAG: hypothetical protein EPN47_14850 [Acidobacteria bacterium]|nr:MAG: hypothetical protein EPN47_14850 [Acidobacteriota bacterium]